MKNLILIDQTPLLKAAIKEIEAWHQQIENLEIEIQRFQDQDLKIFSDWEKLIVQKHQEEIDSLMKAYEKLTLFHNWVIFTSDDLRISIPHAYHLMKQEEERFQNGSEEEKEKITALRKDRQDEIEAQMNGFSSSRDDDEDDETFSEEAEAEEQRSREERINEAREANRKEIRFYESLTDKKIKKLMQDYEEALVFLVECVTLCLETYRLDLILKIWKHAPSKVKKSFNNGFKSQFGITLDEMLERADDRAREEAGVDRDEEFDSSAHFENPFSAKRKETVKDPENAELAKIFYRRLMLNVHPDKLPGDFVTTKKSWLDRLWRKIQSAYTDSNVGALQNLHLQVLITLKKYDEVSYSELLQGSDLLKKELNRIREEQKDVLRHPAWGFSQLKSYKKLEKEVIAPYVENKKHIRTEMSRLEKLHADFDEYAEQVARSGGFDRSRRTKRRKRTSNRRRHE